MRSLPLPEAGLLQTPSRDVRGFVVKFYTEEDNYDLVGNDIPVFSSRDAMKFPDRVHSVKAEPHNNIPFSSIGQNNFWNFISLTPNRRICSPEYSQIEELLPATERWRALELTPTNG